MLDQMREPLLKLLFHESKTSFSSTSLLATSAIERRIDLLISDIFVLPPVWGAYKRQITTYLFVPNNLMAFMRYIQVSMDWIKRGGSELNFDRQMHKAIFLTKGLICNSVFEFDRQSLSDLRTQSIPGSNASILFVAPLILDSHNQKQQVKLKILSYKQISTCLVS